MNTKTLPEEHVLSLRVAGNLVSTNAPAVRAEAAELFKANTGAAQAWAIFRLDLTAAQMVDSAGLNLVVSLLKQTRARRAKMQILYTNANLLRTFVFTRLDQEVELVHV